MTVSFEFTIIVVRNQMWILLIDFAYQNLNRTVMFWQLVRILAGDVVFFGPGVRWKLKLV